MMKTSLTLKQRCKRPLFCIPFHAPERELGLAYADELELHDIEDLPDEKMRIFTRICQLAFEATHKQRQVFTGKQILDEKVLPVVPTKDDFNSLGLLTVDRQLAERALPTKTFSFLHLTLQEFLAAYHLVKQCSDSEQLKSIADHGGEIHMREGGSSIVAWHPIARSSSNPSMQLQSRMFQID